MSKTITLTYENILEVARTEAGSPFNKATDEDKVATIASRSMEILETIFWTENEAPEIDEHLAHRVVYQVVGTYQDAVYTAQRRAGAVLNALRGL